MLYTKNDLIHYYFTHLKNNKHSLQNQATYLKNYLNGMKKEDVDFITFQLVIHNPEFVFDKDCYYSHYHNRLGVDVSRNGNPIYFFHEIGHLIDSYEGSKILIDHSSTDILSNGKTLDQTVKDESAYPNWRMIHSYVNFKSNVMLCKIPDEILKKYDELRVIVCQKAKLEFQIENEKNHDTPNYREDCKKLSELQSKVDSINAISELKAIQKEIFKTQVYRDYYKKYHTLSDVVTYYYGDAYSLCPGHNPDYFKTCSLGGEFFANCFADKVLNNKIGNPALKQSLPESYAMFLELYNKITGQKA